MLHNRFRLITQPATIVIDRNAADDSDIEDEEGTENVLDMHNSNKRPCSTSLLSSVCLKGRREPTRESLLKKEAVVIASDDEPSLSDSDSQSLVFVKKVTSPECFHKKLRKLATVPNIVKLQRRDENSKQCSICLTDLKQLDEKQIGRLNCKHVFCFSCILQSSKFSNRCPYCRASFSTIRHGKRVTHVPEARLNEGFDDPMDEPCYICGRNDDFQRLLQCEYCEYAYCHTYCDVRLNSDQPPVGNWYCLSCEHLLRNQLDGVPGEDDIFEDEP